MNLQRIINFDVHLFVVIRAMSFPFFPLNEIQKNK